VTNTQALRVGADRQLEGRRGFLGWSLIAGAVALGLLIYFVGAKDLAARGAWFVVGEAIGITAAILLCLTAMLAARLRPLEYVFGDMTRVYIAHGVCGLTMFGLVTLHPLLYVFGTLPETNAAAGVIVPFKLVALDWCSWILIALAIAPTLFVRLSYDRWRWTHLLLGAAVITTGISLVLTSETFDTFTIPALRIYLGVLFITAVASVAYVSFVRRRVQPKHEYRVVGAEHHEAAKAIEIHLEPVGAPLSHRAGQFAYFDLIDDRIQVKRDYEAHPFSIASAPGDGPMKVVVEASGQHTGRIQEIAAMDEAHALVHGAYGMLGRTYGPKQLWVGGGIGVTPFLALAEQTTLDGTNDVVFVVAVDTPEQAFYMDRLRGYEAIYPGLRVILWPGKERGHPTIAALTEEVPDLVDRTLLLSGPEAMTHDLAHDAHAAGVHRDRIRTEVAIGPPRRWRYASPALRVMRVVIGVEVSVFLVAAIGSTIGRAVS
jgi:predicted ferric reductase